MKSLRKMLGIKTEAEKEREKEMNYRMKVAQARRKANTVRRKMEQDKLQAVELEKNGEHEKAVSLALQVSKKNKVVTTADNQIQQCADIHEMAKTQRAMKEIMDTCQELTAGIIDLAGMEDAMKSQAENEQAMAQLIDAREQMEMFVEGIEDGTDQEVRTAEGEAALAALMAEQMVQEPVKKMKLPEMKRVDEPEEKSETDWLTDRRETLKALRAEI